MRFLTPHPSFASQNPPFSLRFGHGSALTAVQAVIHYLAVALLPSRGRLIFSFKKKKVDKEKAVKDRLKKIISKYVSRGFGAFRKDRTNERKHDGHDRNRCDHIQNHHPTCFFCNQTKSVCTANAANVATSIKERGDTADVAILTNAERDHAGRQIDDTADHEIHERKAKDRNDRQLIRIQRDDGDQKRGSDQKEKRFEAQMTFDLLIELSDEHRAEKGDNGQDHRQNDGKGIADTKFLLEDGGKPRDDTVTNERAKGGANTSENENKGEITSEKMDLLCVCHACYGDGFIDLDRAKGMERDLRIANARIPKNGNAEKKRRCHVEKHTPSDTKLGKECGKTVTNERADGKRHTVPNDGAADVCLGKIFRLDIENTAPERALHKTVDEPNDLHRRNTIEKSDAEVTKTRNGHGKSNDVFGVIITGQKCVQELTCRIAEKEEGADHTAFVLGDTEIHNDGNEIRLITKSAHVRQGIRQATKQNEHRRSLSVKNFHNV